MLVRAFVFGTAFLFGCFLTAAAERTGAQPLMPPGVKIYMTLSGPVFVDGRGMTLYRMEAGNTLGLDTMACPDRPVTRLEQSLLGYNQVTEVPMNVFDPQTRRACTDKYPPFLAPSQAKPVGDWTVHTRENGVRQWAYEGAPLHTSIKDTLPGHANGGGIFVVASAPLDTPPGIGMRLTTAGLALANHEGRTLYHADSGVKQTDNDDWLPVIAPVAATNARLSPDWSIVKFASGLRQWAWKGKPLFTSARDTKNVLPKDTLPSKFVELASGTYGRPSAGWHIALLKAAPRHPAEVRIISDVTGFKGYADVSGAALYTMSCNESTLDQLDCDDIGDSPRYWLSFCGGEARCLKSWRPLAAPAGAKPIDDAWSVVVLNPRHPFKPVQTNEAGITVWAYRGRPVFTHGRHRQPGDYSATAGRAGSMMGAEPIAAFAGQ